MSDQSKTFISHTTHDQRDSALAHKLSAGLQARGTQVWIAPDSIPVGSEWEPEIVSGIMDQCTHFLVIISAASVASRSVLKEIELARERQERDDSFAILPLVVGRVGDYPGSDFTARFQNVPYHDDFSSQMEAVAAALGLRPAVPNQFEVLINDKTEGFVGREYVFSAITTFLASKANGYFIIEGDPGVGKSAILAEYVRRTGCVAHFNVRSEGINRATQFLESICTQLIARYDLPYSSLPPDATHDGAFLARLLNETQARLGGGERLVIGIDALDEVELVDHTPGANILYLPATLPTGVYFIMTRRQVDLPLVMHTPQELLDLMQYRAESLEDVKTYIRRATERPKLAAWIDEQGLTTEEFITALADKSESNFMYLRYVLPDIEQSVYQDLSIENLPSGLKGYYEDHWRRMGMTAKPLPRTKIRIVYILAEVRQPVSQSLITEFADEDALTVQEVLDEWAPFLRKHFTEGQTRYSVYHTSFRDFLHRKDIVQAAGVTVKDINALIADNLWAELFGNEWLNRSQ
jgi:hypothetical protein